MSAIVTIAQRLDAHIQKVHAQEELVRYELQRALRGQRWDSAAAAPWVRRDESPSTWAIQQLARMVVADSAEFAARGIRVDAGETRLFATMLQHVVARAVPTLYVPNQARAAYPEDGSIPAGATSVRRHRIIDHDDDDLGMIANKGGDVKLIDIGAEWIENNVEEFARGFFWSLMELEQAVFANVPLNTELLEALNRAAERVYELVALQGVAAKNIIGAYNDGNVTITPAPTGTWATATTEEIYGDCKALIEAVKTASGDNYRPNRFNVPSNRWQYMTARRTNTDANVMEMLEKDYPGLVIQEISRASNYDALGTGPRLMAYYYNPAFINIAVARRFTLEAPQRKDLGYKVIGRQRLGGCVIAVPLTVGYMDGI